MAYDELGQESNFYFYLDLCDNDIFKLVKKAQANELNMPRKVIERKCIELLLRNGFAENFIAMAIGISLRRVYTIKKRMAKREKETKF